jgi:hypothetical protein
MAQLQSTSTRLISRKPVEFGDHLDAPDDLFVKGREVHSGNPILTVGHIPDLVYCILA